MVEHLSGVIQISQKFLNISKIRWKFTHVVFIIMISLRNSVTDGQQRWGRKDLFWSFPLNRMSIVVGHRPVDRDTVIEEKTELDEINETGLYVVWWSDLVSNGELHMMCETKCPSIHERNIKQDLSYSLPPTVCQHDTHKTQFLSASPLFPEIKFNSIHFRALDQDPNLQLLRIV